MGQHKITVILEDIRSALNVGAIFRTSDGAGIEELVLAGITPYPPHNRIPKTALGAVENVKWSHYRDQKEAIDIVSKNQPLVAVELTEDAVEYTDFNFPEPVAIIFGNEISGVSKYALSKSIAKVKIPMHGIKESLNIATSYGIVVYEIIRQYKHNNHA